jgi:hypothetical protein
VALLFLAPSRPDFYITTGVFLKFGVEVGVEESIVNALYGSRISCLNLTPLHEWCGLNFDAKLKKKKHL